MALLIALIIVLLSGNIQIFSTVKAGGGHREEGGGGGGGGHRSALSRQEETVRQVGKPASKQCPSNNILFVIFVFRIKHKRRKFTPLGDACSQTLL